jgi:hypothetical protein
MHIIANFLVIELVARRRFALRHLLASYSSSNRYIHRSLLHFSLLRADKAAIYYLQLLTGLPLVFLQSRIASPNKCTLKSAFLSSKL